MVIQEENVSSANVVYYKVDELNRPQMKNHVLRDSFQMDNVNKTCINDTKSGQKHCNSIAITQFPQIDKDDLEELRTVYKKCKSVMKKIETKYGHLLNLEESQSKKRKRDASGCEDSDSKCECSLNKKIVFDDNGKEITTEPDLDNHICVKKLMTHKFEHVPTSNLQIDYEAPDPSLPEDLYTLTTILRDSEIETIYRNKVIKKIKMIKQEYVDEVRFNKHSLIDKIKANPDEVLDFKGTNLKDLPGYALF